MIQLVRQAMETVSPGGIICLTGVGSPTVPDTVSATTLATDVVLKNIAVFGSVNANRAHYEAGAQALAQADPAWLGRLISRRVPLESWKDAYQRQPDDVKVVLQFST